jgi:hypothetical protein
MSLNTEAQSNEDYLGYVDKLAVPLGLESTRAGSATVNVRSEDVEALETVWESSKLEHKTFWDQKTAGDVLSIEQTGDSSFKLSWRTKETFAWWARMLIKNMYGHGYMLQAKDGEMHFEPKQKWKATGLSPRNGYDGIEGYIIVEDNNIPLCT